MDNRVNEGVPRDERLFLVVDGGGPDGGRRLLLVEGEPRIVGRARDADLVLTDLAVSRRHAEVRADGGAVRVATLPGVAPLLLDGQATERATLARGARLLIGQTWLRVESADSGGERVGSASDFSRGKGPIGARVCPNPTYAHSAFHSRRKPRT